MNNSINRINVISWASALHNNFAPGNYTINHNEIPHGKTTAILDCKIWAKKIMGINCYFTATCLDKKFQLTVYCDFKNGTYKVPGSAINFATCPINNEYDIEIRCGPGNKVVLTNASIH